jgi:pimeloyl-ACP methyl ester carboxylesterase
VFLHAGVTDRRAWNATIESLGGQVIATTYDRRGFGETPPARSPFDHIADLFAVLDNTGEGGPVWLVGNSEGGGIALEAALLEPDRVAGLVLLAPAVSGAPTVPVHPDSSQLREAIEVAEGQGDLDEVNRLELRLWLDGPGQPEGRVSGDARRLVRETNRIALMNEQAVVEASQTEPVWDRLADITQPVLVLCGDFDLPQVEQPGEVARRIIRALQ